MCPECRHSAKPNEFHCFICGVCVSRYDHHCPWINNCVSVFNIGKFALFLLLLAVGSLEVLFLALSLQTEAFAQIIRTDLISIPEDVMSKVVLANLLLCGTLSILVCIAICSLLGDQLKNIFTNSTAYERAKNTKR